jgi:hypothetical protein
MIWDVRINRAPIQKLFVTDYLHNNLIKLYDSERIYDKFRLDISPCQTKLLTGGYDSCVHVIDLKKRENTKIKAEYLNRRGTHVGENILYKGKHLNSTTPSNKTHQMDVD